MAAAVVAGAVVGALARNLPARLALVVLDGADGPRCGMEEVLRCAVETLPRAIGGLIVFGLTTAGIALVAAVLGGLCLAVGIDRVRRATRPPPRPVPRVLGGPPLPSPGVSVWPGLGLVALGASLVVPAGWLAGSFVVFLVT